MSVSSTYASTGNQVAYADLKAAFIFNFARFTRWPDELLTRQENLHVCYDRENDVVESLLKLQGRVIHDKPITIQSIRDTPLAQCQVLYLGGEANKIPQEGLPPHLLTISDQEGFVEQQGMIEIFLLDNRVSFKVNLKILQSKQLTVSGRLLNLAHTIGR